MVTKPYRVNNNKIKKVMREYEEGKLYSGKGKEHKVIDRNQALAIAISEQRAYDRKKGKTEVYHL